VASISLVEELLDAARKDGEHTALLIAMNAVDLFLDRSATLEEFKDKWRTAKALYEEFTA
jgi:hypothetical protein